MALDTASKCLKVQVTMGRPNPYKLDCNIHVHYNTDEYYRNILHVSFFPYKIIS